MESTIVIKVKHEETLRRLNARSVNGSLGLNFDELREKIISLFKFTPDAELTLTYVDEDGDVVTLGDDEDLCDVVRQALNPLRITVKLSTEKGGMSSARTSGNSTPLRSPRVQQPPQDLSSNVLLKSAPEPIRQTVSKIITDLASSGAPSGQTVADLVQCFSEMGLSYLNQLSDLQADSNITTQDGTPGCIKNVPAPSQDAEGLKGDAVSTDVLPSAGFENQSSKGKEVFLKSESNGPELNSDKETSVNGNGGVKALDAQLPGLEVPKEVLDSANPKQPFTFEIDSSKEVDCQSGEQLPVGNVVHLSSSVPPISNTLTGDKKEASDKPNESMGRKSIKAHAFPSYPANAMWSNLSSQARDSNGGANNVNRNGLCTSPGSNLIPIGECPFRGISLGNSPAVAPDLFSHVVQPRRNTKLADNSGIAFHSCIRCDGCGAHPITGPRFKSKVKDDYDLCSICFGQMGNEEDYIRMDRPVAYRHPYSHNRGHTPPQPPVFRRGGVKLRRPKLESRFIQDVNILDGTIMAPSTPFTKIWRMRNNGSVVWPQGTQLVWIGGDKMSDMFSVDIEIASAGLPVDQELDIAVDFVAPKRPGRYISYWRMAAPSGQKFGQRIWVLIQVDASSKELPYEGFRGFNLNLPPVSNGISGPEIINVNPETGVADSLREVNNSIGGMRLVEPVPDASPDKEQEANFPIDDSLLVGGGAVSSCVPDTPAASGFYPIIDLSEVALPVAPPLQAPVTVLGTSSQDVNGKANVDESLLNYVEEQPDVEATLLKGLEEMGFNEVDLNKEILRLNGYDWEKSVEDLCDMAGCSPVLKELYKMGFCDKAKNQKLLKKNNGSIKGVVMDLLAEEE